ncbi:DUF1593 domain-containing protein [Algoriphagus sp. C2-6-M1]|uniref:nucleoside hydrolase-like domain-containing protein n=1 Tax=Algoriphagus persicinus TaxID=3108754 RepID=UPI002B38FA18|nr:nucleoside hydrolase-like domain-containing protein [Algoriphagus sp. C2-6-M1]MEB2780745.1 DUF1593 domain-containing protein [Algoriphagus sp. C2-6-M1]
MIKRTFSLKLFLTASTTMCILLSCAEQVSQKARLSNVEPDTATVHSDRPRVIISSDIGGTDDDDYQSLIHYLMYADRFETEGLISSPFGNGRTKHIFKILDLYEKDYPKLVAHSNLFPTADEFRKVVKQGALNRAPGKGWATSTEGSEWIIKCARIEAKKPLWVLVWGGLEDLAQALHDAPEIADVLRVYWIGGPNKKWSAEAYNYVVQNFPDLWMIEANATYRGWFVDDASLVGFDNETFYEHHIKGAGAMGDDFINYYDGEIKMGDTPSMAYLLQGTPKEPGSQSWGGSFIPLKHSSRRIFNRETTLTDEVPVFGMIEWVMQGPDRGPASDEPALWLEVSGQRFEGYYEGEGKYRARFVPKSIGKWSYQVHSHIAELSGRKGQFTSTDPWPGELNQDDIVSLRNWWSDSQDTEQYAEGHQGAKTIARWRKDYLRDWAERLSWLSGTKVGGVSKAK